MSNRAYITLREVKELKTGKKWTEAHVHDDYNCDSIELLPEEIPYQRYPKEGEDKTVDSRKLLRLCLRTQKHPDYCYQQITDIFDYVCEAEKGIHVESEYFSWDDIKDIMKYNWVEYDPEKEACERFFGGDKLAYDVQLNPAELEALDRLEYQILYENGLKNINGGYSTITIYEVLPADDFEDNVERLLCEVKEHDRTTNNTRRFGRT
jgi:hypothetical protein